MDQNKKKIFLFLGSLFVAVIFLSSYASFGNGVAPSTSTTTVNVVQTIPAFGSSVANIIGYGPEAYVTFSTNTAATGQIATIFSKLESNGSIYSALPTSNSSYDVQVATINAYSLQELLRSTLSNSVAVNVSSSYIDLSLPSNVLLYYGGYPITAHLKNQNYTISNVTILKAPGTLVNVSISALVIPTNGTVYRNQISVRLT